MLTIRILRNEHEQRTEINILAKLFSGISWKISKTIIRFHYWNNRSEIFNRISFD